MPESPAPAPAPDPSRPPAPAEFHGSPLDAFGLSSRAVVITGACGILGRVFAATFARAGGRVAMLDLAAAGPAAAAEAVSRETGAAVLGVPCNVASPESVTDAFAAVRERLGGVDVLLNNAASKSSNLRAFFEPAETFSPETWREVMAVNMDGLFLVAQAAGRDMLERGRGGSIVQVSSVYGTVAPDPSIYEGSHYLGGPINTPPVYSASKAGVVGLTRYLAACWGPRGIRVNCISPGGVFSGQNDVFRGKYERKVPLGRMADSQEVANAALFLASPAASYITGHNLMVDGGMSIW